MPLTDPWFYVVAVPAIFLMGMGKGGFGGSLSVLAMPLMAMSAPPLQAAAIALPVLLAMDAISVWSWRKTWSRTNLIIMLPAGIAGTMAGYLTATVVSDAALRLMLGLLALIFCMQTWLSRADSAPPKQPSWLLGSFWSGIAGFTSFISHVGGPPLSVYMLPQKLPKEVFAGTFTMYFAIINSVKIAPFFAMGFFTGENLWTSAVLLPVAVAATAFGVWLVRRISTVLFFKVIYIVLFIVGLKLTWEGLRGILI
jgi:uncharacterized protein